MTDTSLVVSDRVKAIGISKILAITNQAAALQRQGRDVISLSIGEPDFDTPDFVKVAAIRAIQEGDTKYTALDGSPELKIAIRDKFERENGISFTQKEITASAGAKQVLFNAMMATLNPGDEVILPTPYWVSYPDIIAIAGGRAVEVATLEDNDFRLTPAQLEAAITPKTRWLLLNSPSNPSGTTYGSADYLALLNVMRRHPNVWLVVDDMYEHILFDGRIFVTPAQLAPDLRGRILTVNGVSKAYAMTGWRIGYAGGPENLIKQMAIVQSQSTSCPSSVSQRAAIAALSGPQDIVRARCVEFESRRNEIVRLLDAIPGLSCRRPDGSFYAFAGCGGVLGKRTPSGIRLATDVDFAGYLLDQVAVAVVPGLPFGQGGYFRVSFATSLDNIQNACQRIDRACRDLSS
jgi:aspartate aminotransferase